MADSLWVWKSPAVAVIILGLLASTHAQPPFKHKVEIFSFGFSFFLITDVVFFTKSPSCPAFLMVEGAASHGLYCLFLLVFQKGQKN